MILGTHEVFISAPSASCCIHATAGSRHTAKNADVAMYHAKAQGRSRFFFYQESMRAASAQQLSIEHDLRKALEGEQFELYYQPQIEILTGKIVRRRGADTLEPSDARNARAGPLHLASRKKPG